MHLWNHTCNESCIYIITRASSLTSTKLPLQQVMQLWNFTFVPHVYEIAFVQVIHTYPLACQGFKNFLSYHTHLRNPNWCITNSPCLFETFPDKQFQWPSNVILVNQKCKHLGSGLCWMDLKMSYGRSPARSLSLVWQSHSLPGTCFSRLNMILCNTSKTSINPSLSGLQLQNASHVQHFMKLLFLAQSIFLLL